MARSLRDEQGQEVGATEQRAGPVWKEREEGPEGRAQGQTDRSADIYREALIEAKSQGSYFHDSSWQLIINTRILSSG